LCKLPLVARTVVYIKISHSTENEILPHLQQDFVGYNTHQVFQSDEPHYTKMPVVYNRKLGYFEKRGLKKSVRMYDGTRTTNSTKRMAERIRLAVILDIDICNNLRVGVAIIDSVGAPGRNMYSMNKTLQAGDLSLDKDIPSGERWPEQSRSQRSGLQYAGPGLFQLKLLRR
jgi:hypothetical protein